MKVEKILVIWLRKNQITYNEYQKQTQFEKGLKHLNIIHQLKFKFSCLVTYKHEKNVFC